MELLLEAAVRPDRAVIVVTHDSRIFNFADRIAYMEDGRVVRVESKAEMSATLEPTRHSTQRLHVS